MLTERKTHGWMVCYAFMLAFFLVMVPSLAYADTYVATEDSAVRAAMVYLGYDPDEGESTNKLVTAFYDATSGDEYTGWQSFVNGLYQPLATVNYNEQWWSPADGFMFSNQVDRARADAAKIYAAWKKTSGGGSGGSSGGSEIEGDSNGYLITLPKVPTVGQMSGTVLGMKLNGQNVAWGSLPDTLTLRLPTNFFDRLTALGIDSLYMAVNPSGMGEYLPSINVFLIAPMQGYTQTFDAEYQMSGGGYVLKGLYGLSGARKQKDIWSYSFDSNGVLSVPFTSSTNLNEISSTQYLTIVYMGLVDVSDRVVQDPNEPEPEPEPEPPTPPEPPRDPTPPTPDPTQPSQTIDLQGIIDRLDIIIRNQVVLINWLDDAFASVNQNIQWLGELIDESFGWLWEVLGNLQSSIDSGISRITTWLEMIYRKIGGQGGTVSRPNIDTPTPWDDFLSWLEGILQRLLDLIFGVTPAALQNLLSGLADLTTKFPFSIPWDLAALFALFVHAPVTPVADIPLMVPFANAPLSVHVDCTTWDGLAAIMRDGETILFAAWLVMATPNFYRHLNNVSGAD